MTAGRTSVLSLAAGTALDAAPAGLIRAAADAGFDACGLRLDPDALSAGDVGDIRRRLDDTGIDLLDVEVVRMAAGRPARDHATLLDLAAALGASWVLTVLRMTDPAEQADRLAELDGLAAERGLHLSVEFMAFTGVRTLHDAVQLVSAVPRCRILVDALHLTRTGGTPAEVAAAGDVLSYLQLCDGPADAPGTGAPEELADEARHHRQLPGEGSFDLTGLLRAAPERTPVSVEVQSDAMAAALDADERARRAYAAAVRVLDAAAR